MAKRAEYNGWLLGIAVTPERRKSHQAWVSDPQRFVLGYATAAREPDAVRAAMINAGVHPRKNVDALAGLETEYFGPAGMLAAQQREATEPLTIPNPLAREEPELAAQLVAFRLKVDDMLLDKLAAKALADPGFRASQCQHPMDDVTATAQLLRVLTKESWDMDDLAILDACWHQALNSGLFGDEFEAERHRIRYYVDIGRERLLASQEPRPKARNSSR